LPETPLLFVSRSFSTQALQVGKTRYMKVLSVWFMLKQRPMFAVANVPSSTIATFCRHYYKKIKICLGVFVWVPKLARKLKPLYIYSTSVDFC
jgi:hypothetical protein